MNKMTLTAAALFAALGAQSIHAQGQSSGEDTQRPDRQAQSAGRATQDKAGQTVSNQNQQPRSSAGSPAASGQGTNSSAQASNANKQNSPKPDASVSSQPTTGSSISNDFKSDTAATGRIHEEGSPRQSSAAQGTAASGQSGNAKASPPPK